MCVCPRLSLPQDRFVDPDFVAMRLQLLLHGLCHEAPPEAADGSRSTEPKTVALAAVASLAGHAPRPAQLGQLGALLEHRAAGAATGGESVHSGRGGGAHAGAAVSAAYVPLCGVGSHFYEQAHRLHLFNASCSCGWGMSIAKP